ncbi:VOC family protein [Paenibacillus sp. HJGM_3]|uniref:VOC family protein n=1 Tax=Paenibacillus sp. HJGM_3 TaxID=3379816 RepID=UPI00385AA253
MENKFKFSRIGYVYVPATRIDESIEWYTRHLDFRLIDKFHEQGSYLAVLHHPHQHSIALLLVETAEHKPLAIARNGTSFPIMALNCPDIEFTHRRLSEDGINPEPLMSIGDGGEAKYFFFRDPDGNLLEAAWSIWDPQDDYKEDFLRSGE